jgi:cytochrome b subunit of formate dehydrogenase
MRVLVFIVIIVTGMDMWRSFAVGRGKLRRLRLTVLHRVLVVLVLEDLRVLLL